MLLENAEITPRALYDLARLPALEALDTSENYSRFELANIDLARLLESAPNLRRLRLNKLGLGPRQAIALARSPHPARLTRLDLGRNEIGDDGARAIATSEHLRNLLRLNLNANKLSTETKALVREVPQLSAAQVQDSGCTATVRTRDLLFRTKKRLLVNHEEPVTPVRRLISCRWCPLAS